MANAQPKARWLTPEESTARGYDAFGLVNETHFSLRSPREVDETASTIEAAMKEATRMMLEDFATSVSIVRPKHWQDPSGHIQTFEDPARGSVVLGLNGDLEDFDEDDE